MNFPRFCPILQTSKGPENLIRHPGLAGLASVVFMVWQRQAEAGLWFSSFLLLCLQGGTLKQKAHFRVILSPAPILALTLLNRYQSLLISLSLSALI